MLLHNTYNDETKINVLSTALSGLKENSKSQTLAGYQNIYKELVRFTDHIHDHHDDDDDRNDYNYVARSFSFYDYSRGSILMEEYF